ncbi:SbcC/MukB-like Walker B domain-containing protein [Roseateles asaccharophilus]|uniref:Energy-coupling factor transporter ATP-binding protein EcfA2 n=1 Tax=Roseateles asaccharophilus TaxID=582607 RepID=A0ABU2AAU5_9BURK|nr:SbcC/MukB-like Walker B domain-containing protein [Roseateles asaccharophilus]MDR7334328.1 energy-coupling factor transporter ATP-binding protein EcfA2 [Roseateles asaccharophilus]
MKHLIAVHLVQFSFWDYETFVLSSGGTAFIGPNGAGKTSLVDAVQIALIGAHGGNLQFNAQSVHANARSLRDYALGTMRSGDEEAGIQVRKRDEATSYITLVFQDDVSGETCSAGIALESSFKVRDEVILGLFVLPGVMLTLGHHLEDFGVNGKAPMDWDLFAAQARQLSAKAGRTPTITKKPETYLEELLHQLSDQKKGIDPRKFLKALRQSLKLKDIQSVNDFLRQNLVEATKIDRSSTLRLMQTYRNIIDQIELVNLQLSQLDSLTGRYDNLARLHKTKAVVEAVRLGLLVESSDAEVARLTELQERLKGSAVVQTKAVETAKADVESTFRTYEDLLGALNRDPEASAPEQAKQLQRAMADASTTARREVEQLEFQVADALQQLTLAFEGADGDVHEAAFQALQAWDTRRQKNLRPDASQVSDALQFLKRSHASLEGLFKTRGAEHARAERAKTAVANKLHSAAKGRNIKDENIAAALRLFDDRGIGCRTAASVLTLKDTSWQEAVETLMGGTRYAILVDSGKEDDATGLVRRYQIPEVAVIQPDHFQSYIGATPLQSTVAALFESKDPVAKGFVNFLYGTMKTVQTEEELRKNPRSLTKDGMLSTGGVTKRMRLIESEDFLLGVELSRDDRESLRRELIAATEAEKRALAAKNQTQTALGAVGHVIRSVTEEAFRSALLANQSAQLQAAAALEAATKAPSERLTQMRATVDEARTAHTAAQERYGEAGRALATLRGKIDQATVDLAKATETLEEASALHSVALADPDYDGDLAATRVDQVYRAGADGLTQELAALVAEGNKATASIAKLVPDIRDQFIAFINEHSMGLIEERNDWRQAAGWIKAFSDKLRSSTLQDYRAEAAAAEEAAKAAFESDIKFGLREALRGIDREINDLNKILATCPTFSNNERYKFVSSVDPQYKSLYDLIVSQSQDGTKAMFGKETLQSQLMGMLKEAEQGGAKGKNPISDYRLFYLFDLAILVDGKEVDRLSQRMGKASNGEHRVPFYVIAGASLASAYRIQQGDRHRGAGVMILDEAFYGMDAQNTVATAEFLKSLGLQLVMAGPDADTSKLTAVLDSYYDLTRFGPDVFVEWMRVTEQARQLLQSDMPGRHPHLLDAKVQQLSLVGE